jgi:predicted kinase
MDSDFGTPASIASPMLQNFSQLRHLLDTDVEIAEIDRLEQWCTHAHANLSFLMEERRRSGFIRECHGDLHLGNIIWNDDGIQIFDCIEFNPALRWIDVASEIAFTVMDLCARGRSDWGARFLNAYLESTEDYASLRLLPFYLVYRALVRAKVARIRASQANGDIRAKSLIDYADHLRLAEAFIAPRRLALIITRGVSGSGKTTVSQWILEHFAALRLRSDIVRKRLHGLKPDSSSHSALAADLYTDSVSQATYAELLCLARVILESGFPVVVDATFLKRSQREVFERMAADCGVSFLILDCSTSYEDLRQRVILREADGKDASEANLAVLDWQLAHDQALDAQEMKYAVAIDTQSINQESILSLVSSRIYNT